jgi:ABC-type phosphate/phosphonate transport system substrate-binding protein
MFGPEFSSVRWFAAKLLFEQNGLNIEKDLKSYSHGQHCQDIAFNVQFGAVDAGVVCDHFLEGGFKKQNELGVNPEKLAVIGSTKSIPTRVFAARRDFRVDIAAKVVQALLKLNSAIPAHETILCHAELGGFQTSKATDYDDVGVQLGITAEE